ncbi:MULTISPECIES: efflux RND transporter periplasmic adaptor subunit [unclassified Arcicella]|uniref:efflux RND transporter periplasmic adaptor subunit n=1 Tax=unclassified Arcicella TaxID=2644986 RepID=UPI002861901C|nr:MULTISPECIES: efflux RND transporter periplasmic adaptor subunit [unclassified Arcicella]MDR6560773.1 RND family efflux transporter MFP subunit [Arcicella sp. BE51]MDR6810657.1 RND family efflux transporter MFP subunit [Arcicella sp. BE140]MDR6822007.1 RND family efflux transporter MFP subunit [Arcicella sp. BE139]
MKIIYFLFLSLLLFSCKKTQEQTQPEVMNISESVYASGIVKSKNQYQVFSKVNGIIDELYVKEGDFVQKGQPLMKIFNQTSKLNTENAALIVENTAINANADKLKDLSIAIDLAHKKLQSDSLLFLRQSNLWAQQIGTKVELEQRELAYSNAKTAYQSAILKYKELKRQVNFSAAQSKKNLAISQTMEADYTLKSEYTGRLYSLQKEKGEMVNLQTAIAVIGDANMFSLELQVDEDDVVRVKIGQKIMVSMDSYQGKAFEAIVYEIDPLMNEKTRAFTVKAYFTKQPKLLYPNLTVEANIIIQTKQKALTIPRNYLVDDSYVLNEKNEKVKVKIGLKDYQSVEIISGLTAQDIILKPAK